ncbi:ribonuclease H family protein [Allohahella marinimesophila]|uniref:Ribonuclease H1 N-terminal domain-containing protein n=1 Tax=Allohahella marinimesophila TaxID=1054972 RepID=A0ABP7Q751_9GAMM
MTGMNQLGTISPVYVVWNGSPSGLFTSWPDAEKAVCGVKGASCKKYGSWEDAEHALMFTNGVFSVEQKALRAAKNERLLEAADLDYADFDDIIFFDGAVSLAPLRQAVGLVKYENGALASMWYGMFKEEGLSTYNAEVSAFIQAVQLAVESAKAGRRTLLVTDSTWLFKRLEEVYQDYRHGPGHLFRRFIADNRIPSIVWEAWVTLQGRISIRCAPKKLVPDSETADRLAKLGLAESNTTLKSWGSGPLEDARVEKKRIVRITNELKSRAKAQAQHLYDLS